MTLMSMSPDQLGCLAVTVLGCLAILWVATHGGDDD